MTAYIYEEPVRGGYPDLGFLGFSGLDRMRAGVNGSMPSPPNHHLTGLRSHEAGEGTSAFTMPVSPWLQASGGLYTAGVSALAADAPLGGAVLSTLGPGVYGVTSELSMNFLRPVSTPGGTLTARARLIDAGRSLGLSEAVVSDERGTVLSHCTSRYFLTAISPIPDAVSPPVVERITYPTPDPYLRPLPAPQTPRETLLALSGLELFEAIRRGDLPPAPFALLYGLHPTEASEGKAAFTMRASEWLCSPARTIYGGNIAFFADAVMMAAVTTTLPAGSSAATLDLKVQFLRPGLADNREITGRGEVVHRGRSLAVTRAELTNADGKQIAIATGSSMILEGRPWQSVSVADEPARADES